LRQVAPDWEPSESTALLDLGGESTWVPDYRFVHKPSGIDVYVEILGFWKRSSVERLLRLLPVHGPDRYILFLSERLKVDEEALDRLDGPVLRFKEIPNAVDFAAILAKFKQDLGEEVASVPPGS
jgi:predicted nuclease of restriction endonuclease-like RecB superfamily